MIDLQKASEDHGWDVGALEYTKNNSIIYEEFDIGMVALTEIYNVYIMTAFSIGDNHSLAMWRLIRSILTNYRDRPIITSYTDNREKLLKASEKYNYILGEGNIVIFPTQGQEHE